MREDHKQLGTVDDRGALPTGTAWKTPRSVGSVEINFSKNC